METLWILLKHQPIRLLYKGRLHGKVNDCFFYFKLYQSIIHFIYSFSNLKKKRKKEVIKNHMIKLSNEPLWWGKKCMVSSIDCSVLYCLTFSGLNWNDSFWLYSHLIKSRCPSNLMILFKSAIACSNQLKKIFSKRICLKNLNLKLVLI